MTNSDHVSKGGRKEGVMEVSSDSVMVETYETGKSLLEWETAPPFLFDLPSTKPKQFLASVFSQTSTFFFHLIPNPHPTLSRHSTFVFYDGIRSFTSICTPLVLRRASTTSHLAPNRQPQLRQAPQKVNGN
jgi:hypothetical protein